MFVLLTSIGFVFIVWCHCVRMKTNCSPIDTNTMFSMLLLGGLFLTPVCSGDHLEYGFFCFKNKLRLSCVYAICFFRSKCNTHTKTHSLMHTHTHSHTHAHTRAQTRQLLHKQLQTIYTTILFFYFFFFSVSSSSTIYSAVSLKHFRTFFCDSDIWSNRSAI